MRNTLTLIFTAKRLQCLALLLILAVIPVCNTMAGVTKAKAGLQQEKIDITGTVKDGQTGQPLPGVTVLVKGTSNGTISDLEGRYTLKASPEDILVFSFIGYMTEEVTVGTNTTLDLAMSEDIIGLNEVVVTGYGVQKKSDLTGAISSISGESLTKIPVSGIDQAMQGKAAGVNISSKSGRPGEGSTIQIRGITSINGSQPLVILDGIPTNPDILSQINSSDIESIEVLKDASSAAIYGASGGNGVIILSTKKGKSGKMVTNFNFYRGVEAPVSKLELMNSQEWLQTIEETNNEDVAITSRPDTFPTYNWQNYVFQPSPTQSYDISFQGGSEKSNYLISGSYFDQEGIIRNSAYSRITLRVNSEHQVTKRIKIDEKIYYVNALQNGFNDHLWHEYYDGPIRPAFQMAPDVPDYWSDGAWANDTVFGGNNPLAKLDMIDRQERDNIFDANFGISIDLIKGLNFMSRFGTSLDFTEIKEYQDSYYNTIEDRRLDTEVKLLQETDKAQSYIAQQYLTYNFSLAGMYHFTLLAGMEAYQGQRSSMYGERNAKPGLPENLQYFAMSTDNTSSNQLIRGTGSKERASSYFGRLNFDYRSKYLLTANLRRDGRSSFGPDNRFGIFPSVSVGWKFSEESFMQNQSFISFGKLRYGYGEIGSYPKTGTPYLSLVRIPEHFGYAFDNVTASVGAAPVQLENPEIHWEPVVTNDLGVDLAFLQNKFTLTAEYFTRVNNGMIMLNEVPYVAGTYSMGLVVDGANTSPEVNIGSIKNSGFEFSVGYRKMDGELKGSFDLNFSTLKNEVLELAGDSLTRGSVHNVSPITLTYVGGSISEFYGWETDGMFTTDDPRNADGVFINQPFSITPSTGDTVYAQKNAKAGDARFKDLHEDGKIDDKDKTFLGSPLPKIVFGFSINLEYKGFDLSAYFNGTIGNKIFNGTKQYLYYYQGNPNHSKDFANRYIENDIVKTDPITNQPVVVVKANHNTDIFRNASDNYAKTTDFYIEDGSYLRLRNLTVGYTFPASYTKKVNVDKFRLYVGAKNLFTLTRYTGMDPETGFYDDVMASGIDIGVYPVTRMFLFGANITF